MTTTKTIKKPKKSGKSWKREVAGGLLFIWVLLTWRMFFGLPPDDVAIYAAIYQNLTMILLPAVLAVFTSHAFKPKEDEMVEITTMMPSDEADHSIPPADWNEGN